MTAAPLPVRPAPVVPRSGPWLQTASGRRWWPLTPAPLDVCWRDIAEALGRTCRFGGHLSAEVPHYSVAQHACLLADHLPPELRLAGLLHDAHEAILGDVVRPVMQALQMIGGGDAWETLQILTDEAIHLAAGIQPPHGSDRARIRMEDQRALATERRDLLADCDAAWDPLPSAWPGPRIRPLPALIAADEWLDRLRRWLPPTAPVQA